MMQIKEKKEMDDQFKKVQKPWAKYLSKVNKAKTDYHNACKAEKTAINQERNASGDSSLSPDQVSQSHVSVVFFLFPFLSFVFNLTLLYVIIT